MEIKINVKGGTVMISEESKVRKDNIEQAVNAGEFILSHLEKALKYAKSAKRFGYLDLVSGGVFKAVKRSKINKADELIKEACSKSDRINEGVKKGNVYLPNANIEFHEFTIVFDKHAVNAMVQSQINDFVNSIEYSIKQVREALEALNAKLNDEEFRE